MSCEICGRGSCTRSFHSLAQQEAHDSGESKDAETDADSDSKWEAGYTAGNAAGKAEIAAVRGAALVEIDSLKRELSALRAKLAVAEKDAKRFNGLQNMPPIEAQAFFWNFQSRKQRAAAIDAAIEKERGNV